MTLDVFNPPRPELSAATLASRRTHLLEEIERSDSQRSLYGRARRRPLLALAILIVVALIPVSALALGGQIPISAWPFLRFHKLEPYTPYPVKGSGVVVIKTGSWNGQDWVLTAFRSNRGGVCWQLTPTIAGKPATTGAGACASITGVPPVAGLPKPPHTQRPNTITFLRSSGPPTPGHGLPGYISGPVVGNATEVVIHFDNGLVVHTSTFAAPPTLGASVRFYAMQLPPTSSALGSSATCRQRMAQIADLRPQKLIGLDSSGRTVAQLTASRAPRGLLNILCQPHRNHFTIPTNLPDASRKLKKVERVTGPYHAIATLAIGPIVSITSYRGLPISAKTRLVQPSRCWRVSFSNGESQGTCTPTAKRYEPELSPQVQHEGRDTFVIAQTPPRTGAAVARVVLLLANGHRLAGAPVDGIVVFAIPKDALSTTKSQRGLLTAYSKTGQQLSFDNAFGHVRFDRQPVYYRSCPPGSRCAG